ncbi:bacteriocin [Lactiplantibacillus plantarum]|uniref:bacteriocin n=1 Tax=Lactiplantibacillus plantarum TaxID=1590 RepID=UPI00107FDAC5|nr:bacteriocin [Lactiplantibacillus plantarum]QBX96048.1 bacteriocin [Lactiplantibacillus plantarum]
MIEFANEFEELTADAEKNISGGRRSRKNGIGYAIGYAFGAVERAVLGGSRDYNK